MRYLLMYRLTSRRILRLPPDLTIRRHHHFPPRPSSKHLQLYLPVHHSLTHKTGTTMLFSRLLAIYPRIATKISHPYLLLDKKRHIQRHPSHSLRPSRINPISASLRLDMTDLPERQVEFSRPHQRTSAPLNAASTSTPSSRRGRHSTRSGIDPSGGLGKSPRGWRKVCMSSLALRGLRGVLDVSWESPGRGRRAGPLLISQMGRV